MKKYNKYKKSGVDWLGEIPEHWEVEKFKRFFIEKNKVLNPSLNGGSISFGKVVYKNDDKIPASTKASYQEVLKGEFLINPLNLNYDLISLRIALSEIDVVVSSGYIVLKNIVEIEKYYYKYLLHRYDVAYMKLLGSGVRQTINFNNLADSLLVSPPLAEQTAIANFLDEKTTKIDKAIANKQKLIALLKERKQIIIQNAVTKGLNPNAKMKYSGIEWIGDIPEHWEVKKLKSFTKLVNGSTPSSGVEKYWKGDIIWITPTDINDVKIINNSERKLTLLGYNNCGTLLVPKGSIIITTRAPIGKVVIAGTVLCTNQGCKSLVITKRTNELFVYYFLLNSTFVLNSLGTGTTFMELSSRSLSNFIVTYPPQNEQQAIVAHIESETAKIDNAINLQENQIEKLKEYKTVLIDSAVTGKIKVS